jgi:hypothetical protein
MQLELGLVGNPVGATMNDTVEDNSEEEEVQFQQEAPGAIVDELARDKSIGGV